MSNLTRACLALLLTYGISAPALAQTGERVIEFSGWNWIVRRSDGLEGPGPNRFLDNQRTVWLDEDERLHLKVWTRNDRAYSAEVILSRPLGYGTYIVESIGRVDTMDPPVIFGIFTYDENSLYNHREIDIEYGRFGDAGAPNAQFVVQPFEKEENRHQFEVQQEGDYLTHVFQWNADSVRFVSFHGHVGELIARSGLSATEHLNRAAGWEFSGEVPPSGDERFRLNLWLYEGALPGRDHEVVVSSFTFLPAEDSGGMSSSSR